MAWGPSLPGWVAVVAPTDGSSLPPGAGDLQAILALNIPVGRAVEIRTKRGKPHTVAVNPVSGWDR